MLVNIERLLVRVVDFANGRSALELLQGPCWLVHSICRFVICLSWNTLNWGIPLVLSSPEYSFLVKIEKSKYHLFLQSVRTRFYSTNKCKRVRRQPIRRPVTDRLETNDQATKIFSRSSEIAHRKCCIWRIIWRVSVFSLILYESVIILYLFLMNQIGIYMVCKGLNLIFSDRKSPDGDEGPLHGNARNGPPGAKWVCMKTKFEKQQTWFLEDDKGTEFLYLAFSFKGELRNPFLITITRCQCWSSKILVIITLLRHHF